MILRHQPGAEMVADLGTKPLLTAKFRELKKKLGMKGFEDKMNHEKSLAKEEKDKASTPGKTSKDLLRLAVIMALVARTKGEEEEMTLGGATIYFEGLVLLYTLAVIAITLFLSYWCGGRTYTQVELEEEVLKKVKALGGSKKEDQSQEEENAPQKKENAGESSATISRRRRRGKCRRGKGRTVSVVFGKSCRQVVHGSSKC